MSQTESMLSSWASLVRDSMASPSSGRDRRVRGGRLLRGVDWAYFGNCCHGGGGERRSLRRGCPGSVAALGFATALAYALLLARAKGRRSWTSSHRKSNVLPACSRHRSYHPINGSSGGGTCAARSALYQIVVVLGMDRRVYGPANVLSVGFREAL